MDEHAVISTETLVMTFSGTHPKHAFSQIFGLKLLMICWQHHETDHKQGTTDMKQTILLALVFAGMTGTAAQAQIHDLGTNPELPTANQPTEFVATFSGCPNQPVNNIDGMPYDLRVNGFEIDLFFVIATGQVCGVPPEGPTITFNLGTLPQGDYILRAASIFDVEPFPDDMTGLDPQIFEFSVGAPTPQPVPALNSIAALVLALLMMSGVLLWRNHSVRGTTKGINNLQP
ncbi:MAG: hypothetical protein Tsb0027_08260 [Wenzhouxiangellaceae bacterium]